MELFNPLKNDVSIVIGGVTYTVKADSSVEVPHEVATAWRETHQFLTVCEPKNAEHEVKYAEVPVTVQVKKSKK